MNFEPWLKEISTCSCGKIHACPIHAVRVERNAMEALPEILKDFSRICLVADTNTYDVCGREAEHVLGSRICARVILPCPDGKLVVPDEASVDAVLSALPAEADLVLGVGSGVINDLSKFCSFERSIPYAIAATAPSMDGYASGVAAMTFRGMKDTRNAQTPYAIVADTKVLSEAPRIMLQSGWGDVIGKLSSLNDWKLGRLLYGEYFCQTVYDMVQESLNQVIESTDEIARGGEEGTARLMEALILSGIAMSYAGNSRPASGSEHHLSHYFEITGLLNRRPYYRHGIDVAYSTVVSAELREKIVSGNVHPLRFDRGAWEQEMHRVYLTSADEIIRLQDGLGWYQRDDSALIEQKLPEIRELMKECPSSETLKGMLSRMGLEDSEFRAFYGEKVLEDGIRCAQDLKERFTALRMYNMYFG